MNIDMFAAGADRMHDDEAENSYNDLTEYDAIGMGLACSQCGSELADCWKCFECKKIYDKLEAKDG